MRVQIKQIREGDSYFNHRELIGVIGEFMHYRLNPNAHEPGWFAGTFSPDVTTAQIHPVYFFAFVRVKKIT